MIKKYGFRRIEGGYYILKSGKTGIYTREEALETMQTEIDPRIGENDEHIN